MLSYAAALMVESLQVWNKDERSTRSQMALLPFAFKTLSARDSNAVCRDPKSRCDLLELRRDPCKRRHDTRE